MLTIALIVLVIIIVKTMMPQGFGPIKGAKPKYSTIPVGRMGEVFDQIEVQAYEGSFAVFIFNTPDRPTPNDAVNLQFSVVNSCVGFDWVLLTKRSIEDRERFIELAQSLGYTVVPQEKNGVKSLRVEDGNVPLLCLTIMQQFYELYMHDNIHLLVQGFRWR